MKITQESNSGRVVQKVAAFFLQHKKKEYPTRVIAAAIGEERRITSMAARQLLSSSFLTRRKKSRGSGELLYSLLSDGKEKADTPVEEIHLKGKQPEILEHVWHRRGGAFTCAEISEELFITRKPVYEALLLMVRYGLLKCDATRLPMSYSIADEKRIAAVLAKKKEKPPLSPFWQSMAVWDSAVRTVCGRAA